MELKINYLKQDYLAVVPLVLFSIVGLFLILGGGLQTDSLFLLILTGMFGVLSPLLLVLTIYRLIRYHGVLLTIGEQGVCFCRKERVIRHISWDDILTLKYIGVDGDHPESCSSDTYSIALKDTRNKTIYLFQSSNIENIFCFLRVIAYFSPKLAGQVVGAGPFQCYRLDTVQAYGQELSKEPPRIISNEINDLHQLFESRGASNFVFTVISLLLIMVGFVIIGFF